MRVICINDDWIIADNYRFVKIFPKKDQIYTVIRTTIDPAWPEACYYVLGEMHTEGVGYLSTYFRRITDISSLQALTKIKSREMEKV